MEDFKIVYDVDDCLFDVDGYVCEQLDLDINDFTDWDLSKLPVDVRNKVNKYYHMCETYTDSKLFDGIDELKSIPDLYIHTYCLSPEVGIAKRDRLLSLGFKAEQIILDFCDKKQDIATLIIVDDNVDNILRSSAKHKIIINKPWNKGFDIGNDAIRVDTLLEANEIVRRIISL